MAKTLNYEEAEELRKRFIEWGRAQGFVQESFARLRIGPLKLIPEIGSVRKCASRCSDHNDSFIKLTRDVPWTSDKSWRYRNLKALQKAVHREIAAVEKRMIAEDERKMDAAIEVFVLGWCAAREKRELRCRDNDNAHPYLAKITDKEGGNPQWVQVIYNEELDTLTSCIVLGDPTDVSHRLEGRLTLHNVEVLYRSKAILAH